MIYLFISFFLVFTTLDAADDDINKKIDTTSSKLSSYTKDYTDVNKKMAENAEAILKQKAEIDKQQEYLKELMVELADKETSYKDNKNTLNELKNYNKNLKSKQDSIQQELVFVIAQSVSLSVIIEEEFAVDSDSLIEFEVLKVMLKESKEKGNNLNLQYFTNAKEIEVLNENTSAMEVAIASMDTKRRQLLLAQDSNKKALVKLELAETEYKKELKELLNKQNTLTKTLEKLNILKLDAEKDAKEKEDVEVAFDNKPVKLDKNVESVKKVGNSYQAVKTVKYTGEKTIAPLDSYTITKKYGNYTDPIYGLKIFNESISMKSNEQDAKVKTVLNGKVIYADKTAVLNNIVIVEHDDGLHTIYANLSQIAPNIEKGQKVKKGFTIGRVSDELVFEVTQKSFHIDPAGIFE